MSLSISCSSRVGGVIPPAGPPSAPSAAASASVFTPSPVASQCEFTPRIRAALWISGALGCFVGRPFHQCDRFPFVVLGAPAVICRLNSVRVIPASCNAAFSRSVNVPMARTSVRTIAFTGVDSTVYSSKLCGMTKDQAASLFGQSHADLARAMEMTRGGISQWPDELTDAQADRVIGAAIRLGKHIPVDLLQQHSTRERNAA